MITSLQTFPHSHKVFREAMISWLGDKLWIKQLIEKRVGVPESKILFSDIMPPMLPAPFTVRPLTKQQFLQWTEWENGPIVNTPKGAFHAFSESGMDILVLSHYVIEKSNGKVVRGG